MSGYPFNNSTWFWYQSSARWSYNGWQCGTFFGPRAFLWYQRWSGKMQAVVAEQMTAKWSNFINRITTRQKARHHKTTAICHCQAWIKAVCLRWQWIMVQISSHWPASKSLVSSQSDILAVRDVGDGRIRWGGYCLFHLMAALLEAVLKLTPCITLPRIARWTCMPASA